MIFVIPSYNRIETLLEYTLQFLFDMEILNKTYHKIFIFVANQQQKEIYLEYMDEDWLNLHILVGKLGIMKQRNYIGNFCLDGRAIVSMDDDIEKLYITNNGIQRPIYKKEFHQLLSFMEKCLSISPAHMIGLSMMTNPFYHHTKISGSLSIVPAGFYMWDTHIDNTIENDAIEDVERSLNYFVNHGIILRLMNVSFHRKDFNKKREGGIQSLYTKQQREDLIVKGYNDLKEKYPDLVVGLSKDNVIKLKKKKRGFWFRKIK